MEPNKLEVSLELMAALHEHVAKLPPVAEPEELAALEQRIDTMISRLFSN